MKPHPIIRQIIDRDCHVVESNRHVIRHVVSKLTNRWRTYSALSRDDRREFMRQCIEVHRENQELYRDVVRGSFGIPDLG